MPSEFYLQDQQRRENEVAKRGQRGADSARSSFLRSAYRRLKKRDPEAALKFMDRLEEMGRPVGATQQSSQNRNSEQGMVRGNTALAEMLKQGLRPGGRPTDGSPGILSPYSTAPGATSPSGVAPGAAPVPGSVATPAAPATTPAAPAAPGGTPPLAARKPGFIDGMPAAEWMKKFGSKPEPIGNQIFDAQVNVSLKEQKYAEQQREGQQNKESYAAPIAPVAKPVEQMSWEDLQKMSGKPIQIPKAGDYKTKSRSILSRLLGRK